MLLHGHIKERVVNASKTFMAEQKTKLSNSSLHVCGRPNLAAAASACVVRQSGTNFHRICEAQTPGNSLSVALSAGYLSVRMAGSASDRRWLKARHTNGLTYLLNQYEMQVLHVPTYFLQSSRNNDAVLSRLIKCINTDNLEWQTITYMDWVRVHQNHRIFRVSYHHHKYRYYTHAAYKNINSIGSSMAIKKLKSTNERYYSNVRQHFNRTE